MSKNSTSSKTSKRFKIYVAMSGGVDSSVAAAILQKAGHEIVGVFFKPWQPPNFSCDWKEERLDAMLVAAKLGIDFKTWDFSKEYGQEVARYMIDGYRAGITPNPDVMCNKEIKFGIFLKKALTEGADYIATGHYAITKNSKLYKAKDENKDQTYFLWTLRREQLRHVMFPIGEFTKPMVRKLAKRFGLPNHAKKDSQGVCFVGDLDMKEFLKEYIKPESGNILFKNKIIGTHEGSSYYTIGQRHGLNITDGKGPYYVSKKEGNMVYVEKSKMKSQKAKISEVNWITPQKFPLQATIKIRYRTEEIPVLIDSRYTLHATRPMTSITPGQSAVIYSGREVLGGGIFQSSPKAAESP